MKLEHRRHYVCGYFFLYILLNFFIPTRDLEIHTYISNNNELEKIDLTTLEKLSLYNN